jgi:hypothetical protein
MNKKSYMPSLGTFFLSLCILSLCNVVFFPVAFHRKLPVLSPVISVFSLFLGLLFGCFSCIFLNINSSVREAERSRSHIKAYLKVAEMMNSKIDNFLRRPEHIEVNMPQSSNPSDPGDERTPLLQRPRLM